jgi:hypothetical protein
MTAQEQREARETWDYYRAVFQRRSTLHPELTPVLPILDLICSQGFNDRLYAGTSLDNLVISTRRNPRSRLGTILVLPKRETVEFRLFKNDGAAVTSEVPFQQVAQEAGRLLAILTEPALAR